MALTIKITVSLHPLSVCVCVCVCVNFHHCFEVLGMFLEALDLPHVISNFLHDGYTKL